MLRLDLELLGPPQIILDGRPALGLTLQKARALLIYLAMERGRDHSRESLVGLLWPDQSEAASRASLRQALSTLREAIGDEGARPPFLAVRRDSIRFDLSESDRLDVTEFLSLLDACAAHRHRHPDRCRACAARRERALALFRGEFLAGFYLRDSAPFDEWAAIQRERLHRRMVVALGRLAGYHEACGDLPRAEQTLQRQLELDPWMEEAHRERIRLLALGGRRSEALAQFETCRRVLAEELGVEPASETVRLWEHVRDGSFPGRGEARATGVDVRLPRMDSRLVGREPDLEDLTDLLVNPDRRLVTITGAGGVGKTHLAIAAAREVAPAFSDGVTFVPLVPLDAPVGIPAAVLEAMEIPQLAPADPATQLRDVLRDRESLLVLDGIEHLLPGAREVLVEWLRAAPKIAILVTSQERLGLHAEWRYELGGLALPAEGDLGKAMDSGAVALFLERGRQADRKLASDAATLTDVTRIVRLVEGVPLAIELAASAIGARTVAEIADALEADVRSLESRHLDVPERHRSQAAAFEYSWRLLDAALQDALARLSVFRGGWDEAAAREVAGATPESLAALCDKSLIRRDEAGRFGFHPLLRRYANDRLRAEGDAGAAHRAHFDYFERFAKTAAEHVTGEAQIEWLGRLDLDLTNLREAMAWGLERKEQDRVAGLCLSLARYWMVRGYLREGLEWAEQVLTAEPGPAPAVRVKLLNRAGILAALQRRFEEAERRLTESVDLSRSLGDRLGEVTSLNSLGAMSIERQEYEQARHYLEACLPAWDELGNRNGLASTLNNLGVVALMRGESEAALGRLEESLLLFRELGDRRMIAGVLYNIGDLNIKAGKFEPARRSLRESLDLRHKIGEVAGVAEALEGLAAVALEAGRPADAGRLLGAAAGMREGVGAPIAPVNQSDHDRLVTEVRRRMGEAAHEAARREGRQLNAEAAIVLALSV